MKRLLAVLFCLMSGFAAAETPENTPNRFTGTDSERIAAAIAEAPNFGGVVRIPPRTPDETSDRTFWLIDSAILVPGNTTVFFENCKIKLSDKARDNFVRSANCGIGIENVESIENVHLIGIGNVVFEGADHPRATGDDGKRLNAGPFIPDLGYGKNGSYGTDAGKEGEHQKGDWRNIGILLGRVDRFTLQNITIREAHAWSVSLERCSNGHVSDLSFESSENRIIDGQQVKTLNQDGLDLRKGCHDIIIENITGHSGDDLVALTALDTDPLPGGVFGCFEASGTRADDDNSIHHIILRNVLGYASGGHQIVRVLNKADVKISHLLIDGIVDTSPEEITDKAALLIGDRSYGGPAPLGFTTNIIVRNVQSKSWSAVLIREPLDNTVIDGVINENPDGKAIDLESPSEEQGNLTILNVIN